MGLVGNFNVYDIRKEVWRSLNLQIWKFHIETFY